MAAKWPHRRRGDADGPADSLATVTGGQFLAAGVGE
jgi:hypothetical protein